MKDRDAPSIDDLLDQSVRQLDGRVREGVSLLRAAQRLLGPALAVLERKAQSGGLTEVGSTTFSIYVEERGLSPEEAFPLIKACRASEDSPKVADAVADAEISVPKAAILSEFIAKPELQRPDDDLIDAAKTKSTRELRDLLNERKAQARLEDKPVPRTLFFSRNGIADLQRTKDLFGAKRKRLVTDSEAAEEALAEYVERHDPERKAARSRKRREKSGAKKSAQQRKGRGGANGPRTPTNGANPTSGGNGANGATGTNGRHIPAEDRHTVVEQFGNRCWVSGCEDRGRLTFAHRRAFRHGGQNRYWNLCRFCLAHHRQFDGGRWKIVVRSGRDGNLGGLLVDLRGSPVGRLRGLPPRAPP